MFDEKNIKKILNKLKKINNEELNEINRIGKFKICKNVNSLLVDVSKNIFIYNLKFINNLKDNLKDNLQDNLQDNLSYFKLLKCFKKYNHSYFRNYINILMDIENDESNKNNEPTTIQILELSNTFYNETNILLNKTIAKFYLTYEHIFKIISYNYMLYFLNDVIITFMIPQKIKLLKVDIINFPK
jgi:hypothetical protein